MQLARGQKVKLADLFSADHDLTVKLSINAPFNADFSCFGLDTAEKLSNEDYMIFFNQPKSPCNSIQLISTTEKTAEFKLSLNQMPIAIDRLVFTLTIDGNATMNQLQQSTTSLTVLGQVVASFDCLGSQFEQERAVMLIEIYRKDGAWRLNAIGQGFNDGLDALVRHFGGAVAEEVSAVEPNSQPIKTKISLEKRFEQEAPHLVDLAKKATISLQKNNLTEAKAQVALVLDSSGSMFGQYTAGKVQEVVNRLLPLAVHFDDDGALQCWAFGDKPCALNPISMKNVKGYIDTDSGGWRDWKVGARSNNEVAVIEQVIDFYKKEVFSLPVYVLFISDGGVGNERKLKKLLTDCANLPIFWQFVGIGGSNYGVLERLDDLAGRVVDNCNFFAIKDIKSISEEKLYDLILEEFPQWLKDIKAKGIF